MQVADFSPALKRAIQLAREAGLTESASKLEERSSAVYATSSEWLGEMGNAIFQFRFQEGKRVPADVSKLLDECLKEIGKVWPRYKPGLLGGLLRRIGRVRP
jgi:hypothetical protein